MITEMSVEICKITIGSVFVVFEHEILPGIRGSIHIDWMQAYVQIRLWGEYLKLFFFIRELTRLNLFCEVETK